MGGGLLRVNRDALLPLIPFNRQVQFLLREYSEHQLIPTLKVDL